MKWSIVCLYSVYLNIQIRIITYALFKLQCVLHILTSTVTDK